MTGGLVGQLVRAEVGPLGWVGELEEDVIHDVFGTSSNAAHSDWPVDALAQGLEVVADDDVDDTDNSV